MRRIGIAVAAVVVVGLVVGGVALAHGGGTDAYGGHNDRVSGGYHFHRGPLAGRTFSSKDAALKALRDAEAGTSTPAPAPLARLPEDPAAVLKRATVAQKFDAVIGVRVRKGLVTEAATAAEVTTTR